MEKAKAALCLATLCNALVTAAVPARAQAWKPAKPVEIVVGSAPGGSPDVMTRLVQNLFQGMALVPTLAVVNKPGAGNTIGWAYLNQHAGDGHYIATYSPAV
ncbi:MAG: putative tricarboxylic transport rane protein [Betaproteobacteria bacterium]|jgi:putative tricarboxylic transport membrane protein